MVKYLKPLTAAVIVVVGVYVVIAVYVVVSVNVVVVDSDGDEDGRRSCGGRGL